MAIFTGKIIEAYYTNPDNTAVEIIYQDGKKAINHYLVVNMSDPDFKDLISEYPLSRIADTTVARNKEALNQLNRVMEARMNIKKQQDISPVDSLLNFVLNYKVKNHADDLFDLKLKIFELPQIKGSENNQIKGKIRQATTPLEVLLAYHELTNSSK